MAETYGFGHPGVEEGRDMRRLMAPAVLANLAVSGVAHAKQPDSSAAFLARNARTKGTVVLPGLQYRILKSGPATGVHPKLSDDLVIHYEGRLPSGEVLDSSFARGLARNDARPYIDPRLASRAATDAAG